MRFDEIELESVPFDVGPIEFSPRPASLFRRLGALLIDLSLFAALALGLTPLLPVKESWVAVGALGGFVLLVSYYYFVGTWMLWGKTVGGAIFDVRVVGDTATITLRAASLRWAALLLSLFTAGIGLLLVVLPSRRSLPDRLSATHCIAG